MIGISSRIAVQHSTSELVEWLRKALYEGTKVVNFNTTITEYY